MRALANWVVPCRILLILCGGLIQAAIRGQGNRGSVLPLPMTLRVPALLFTALVCGHRPAMLAGMAYISLGLFQLPVFKAEEDRITVRSSLWLSGGISTSGLADGTASSAARDG